MGKVKDEASAVETGESPPRGKPAVGNRALFVHVLHEPAADRALQAHARVVCPASTRRWGWA